ncbi:MAG: BrnT family toxin [Pyrinomonadaceae bacterium]
MKFEWDSRKARSNLRKHGVTFEEAASVFDDPLATYYGDPDHSIAERRYLAIGRSAKGRLIHIAFADQAGRIRIIQARKLTRNERQQYEEETR